MIFSVKVIFSECEQIYRFLQICSNLLTNSLLENFDFVLWILIKTFRRKSSGFLDLQDCTWLYKSLKFQKQSLYRCCELFWIPMRKCDVKSFKAHFGMGVLL